MFNIQRLPKVSYFAQEVNLPTLALGSTQQATPFSQAIVAGDMLEYSALTVQFLVDDGMKNYRSIHDWLVGLGFPENHDQYQDILDAAPLSGSNLKRSYSDATLTILGNTNSPIQTIQFVDVFPESLDSMTFVSNSQDVQYLVGSATFRYSYYKFV